MIEVRCLTGAALDAALDDVAALRIAVFRDWPYLYDGDPGYERRYLESYRNTGTAVLVGAFADGKLIGAATGTALQDHDAEFSAPLEQAGLATDHVFYCAESVLHHAYRGQGIGHRFFELREAHAAALGYASCAFCAVIRPDNHPARPGDYRSLDAFWRKRGYAPLDGVEARFSWKDLGDADESEKRMQFWMRDLTKQSA